MEIYNRLSKFQDLFSRVTPGCVILEVRSERGLVVWLQLEDVCSFWPWWAGYSESQDARARGVGVARILRDSSVLIKHRPLGWNLTDGVDSMPILQSPCTLQKLSFRFDVFDGKAAKKLASQLKYVFWLLTSHFLFQVSLHKCFSGPSSSSLVTLSYLTFPS